jgi:hypothetical protein
MLRNHYQLLLSVLFGQRCLSAALLATYVVSAAGVPLPFAHPVHSGELYPCADCPCGCSSAEQCWRSCCCHTMAERFAWAREHNVRPPEYAIAAAKLEQLDLAWLGVKISDKTRTIEPSCCRQVAGSDSPRSCCQERARLAEGAKNDGCCEKHQHGSNRAASVVVWQALKCNGHSLNWLAAVPTLINAGPVQNSEAPLVTWLDPIHSDTPSFVAACPDVPPPKLV